MKRLISLALLQSLAVLSYGQTGAEKIDDLMQAYYHTGNYQGVVLVADSGSIIYQNAFGFTDYVDSIPNSIDNKFRISSMTKQFTAMLTMQLVQDGKLKLTDKITDHLSYYRKETGDKITIHHLLCHQSGIPSISAHPNFRKDSIRIPLSVPFLIKRWCMDDLLFKPGTESRYSNSNYNILGAIIEEVTGKTYETVLREKILEPAGMKNSGLVPDTGIVPGLPTGYLFKDSNYVQETTIAYSNLHAAGQMYSTVFDMYLWDRALANHTLLEKKWQDLIFTPNHNGHGYGWKVYRRKYEGQTDSCTTSYHAGGFEGFYSFIQRFHERNMVMIFMNNTNTGRRKTGAISDDIINILFGLPYELPVQREPFPMSFTTFENFVGTYSGNNDTKVEILAHEDLFIYANRRGRKYQIFAEGPSTFFFGKDHRWTIKFTEDGKTMTVQTPGSSEKYRRD